MSFLIALACAAVIGFAAHRASLCHVKAVSEAMTSGTTHMLKSLTHAALWATLVGGAIGVVGMRAPPPVWLPSSAAWALFGGWLFGIGAALNGGCSLSTLHRLIDGELGMLATLLGFALGAVVSAIAVAESTALCLDSCGSREHRCPLRWARGSWRTNTLWRCRQRSWASPAPSCTRRRAPGPTPTTSEQAFCRSGRVANPRRQRIRPLWRRFWSA
jgi:hypothetical protein